MRRFNRTKGSVITEFGITSMVFLVALLMIFEFGLELLGYQHFERVVHLTSLIFEKSLTVNELNTRLMNSAPFLAKRCLKPVKAYGYGTVRDAISGDNSASILANSDDFNGYRMVKVIVNCQWVRMSPISRKFMGEIGDYELAVFVRAG